jgi:YidC/Oxa1 family membrane protein insertase
VALPAFADDTRPQVGVTANLVMEMPSIAPGGEASVRLLHYVGPKEFRRLERFENREDLVMQFGFFGVIGKLLLRLMNGIHDNLVANYGIAIILTTVLIKLLLWPVTAKAVQSSKRMAKIQVPLKEVRAKYATDKPGITPAEKQKLMRKQQEETMRLFREHKVNPLGGCLPILVQIPIFFALFQMLQSASELRFAEFLWVADLSAPDTVASIFGFPLNILPLFMGVTMFFQMRMMPTPSVDKMQQRIFQFMPAIFLIFCYNFASGLVLYWTVQNLFTILQQWLTKQKDDPAPAAAAAAERRPSAKGLPNRPKKKKNNP